MNKYIKGSMIFTGGMVIGGALVGAKIVKKIANSDFCINMIVREINSHINGNTSNINGYTYKPKSDQPETIFVTTLAEANEMLANIDELFDLYGVVTMADIYDLAVLPSSFRDIMRGWDSEDAISKFRVRSRRLGYEISWPEPKSVRHDNI